MPMSAEIAISEFQNQMTQIFTRGEPISLASERRTIQEEGDFYGRLNTWIRRGSVDMVGWLIQDLPRQDQQKYLYEVFGAKANSLRIRAASHYVYGKETVGIRDIRDDARKYLGIARRIKKEYQKQ